MLGLSDAAAGLAARLRAATGPSAGPGCYADAAAASTAAQLTAQAWLHVDAALAAGDATDPGFFPGPREEPAALAESEAPQLHEAAGALATRCAVLAGWPGKLPARHLAAAAACLACAGRELGRIGGCPPPAAGTR
jgi:hypothetical protein